MKISFDYLNHNGKLARREIEPDALEFIFDPGFGYQPGWVISGHDFAKEARRSFFLPRIVFPDSPPLPRERGPKKSFVLVRFEK